MTQEDETFRRLENALRSISLDIDGTAQAFSCSRLKSDPAIVITDSWGLLITEASSTPEMQGWKKAFDELAECNERPSFSQIQAFLEEVQKVDRNLTQEEGE